MSNLCPDVLFNASLVDEGEKQAGQGEKGEQGGEKEEKERRKGERGNGKRKWKEHRGGED